MKVSVHISVDIDAGAWTLNYGVEGPTDIRADVRSYVLNLVTEQLNDLGVLQ